MFKCGGCGKMTNPRDKGVVRVIETRMKTYYDKQGHYQGDGEEITKEIRICPVCVKEIEINNDAKKAEKKMEEVRENS